MDHQAKKKRRKNVQTSREKSMYNKIMLSYKDEKKKHSKKRK